MPTVFIFHGALGHPEENWFPWLAGELRKRGVQVIVPRFPTPEGQTLENWFEVMRPHLAKMGKETILVGHSVGAVFLLRVLEKVKVQVRAGFLVAGFAERLGLPQFDPLNVTFLEGGFDWVSIRKNCEYRSVYYSDNDPYVKELQGARLAKTLKAKAVLVRGAGHFNEAAGYTRFPLLLEAVEKELKKEMRR